jgi:hypothetical protein
MDNGWLIQGKIGDLKMLDDDDERAEVRKRTEENREKIPQSVLRLLSEKQVTLDDVLKMDRQEFKELNFFLADRVSVEERDAIIRFKNASMTAAELSLYSAMTDEEQLEVAMDDEEFRKTLLADETFPYRDQLKF